MKSPEMRTTEIPSAAKLLTAISALMPTGATRQANNAPQQRRWAFLSLTKIDGVTTGSEILLLVIVDQERWGSTAGVVPATGGPS